MAKLPCGDPRHPAGIMLYASSVGGQCGVLVVWLQRLLPHFGKQIGRAARLCHSCTLNQPTPIHPCSKTPAAFQGRGLLEQTQDRSARRQSSSEHPSIQTTACAPCDWLETGRPRFLLSSKAGWRVASVIYAGSTCR